MTTEIKNFRDFKSRLESLSGKKLSEKGKDFARQDFDHSKFMILKKYGNSSDRFVIQFNKETGYIETGCKLALKFREKREISIYNNYHFE